MIRRAVIPLHELNIGGSVNFAAVGVLSVCLFHIGIYFPIWLSVIVLAYVSLYLLQSYRQKRVGVLLLLIWVVYLLPFIHIPPYVFFDFNQSPERLWGLAVNPYMVDERVITLTGMLGAVGGLGFAFGTSLKKGIVQQDFGINRDGSKRIFRTMALPVWLVWVSTGLGLTALYAPQETFFTAAYTQSKSALEGVNFSSAWMMSYVILTFAFCDALVEARPAAREIKRKAIFAVIALVLVYFQLLRGDRESLSWILGLALLYFYWAAGITQRRGFTIPWSKLGLVVFGLVAVSMVVGTIRSALTGASVSDAGALILESYEDGAIGLGSILHGTWSAALLTPLSVAGDHIHGLLKLKWGQDYLNLILSVIPGFLADAIGYVRPLDSLNGPAWEMRYGQGGAHATVVPFMNFRMTGVFLAAAIWAFLIAKHERMAMGRAGVVRWTLLVTIAMASPHWLWYGDKNGLNAIILWLILSVCYRVSLNILRTSAVGSVQPMKSPRINLKP